MLALELQSAGFSYAQCEEDVDFLIVSTAIKLAEANKPVIVVGQNIDRLVLLNQLNV